MPEPVISTLSSASANSTNSAPKEQAYVKPDKLPAVLEGANQILKIESATQKARPRYGEVDAVRRLSPGNRARDKGLFQPRLSTG